MNGNNHERPNSIWSTSSALPKFESLKTEIKTKVLIIGGGMSGILCAYLDEVIYCREKDYGIMKTMPHSLFVYLW